MNYNPTCLGLAIDSSAIYSFETLNDVLNLICQTWREESSLPSRLANRLVLNPVYRKAPVTELTKSSVAIDVTSAVGIKCYTERSPTTMEWLVYWHGQ